jgi:hypothetical protein
MPVKCLEVVALHNTTPPAALSLSWRPWKTDTNLVLLNLVSPLNLNLCYNLTQMKILSIILIIAYLLLPVLCFGHPCEMLISDVEQSMVVSDASGECPFNHDTDNCETTCCCAGHVHISSFSKIQYNELTSKQLPHESHLSLPQILDRIFVPPQNNS